MPFGGHLEKNSKLYDTTPLNEKLQKCIRKISWILESRCITLYFWQPLGPLTGRITAHSWTPNAFLFLCVFLPRFWIFLIPLLCNSHSCFIPPLYFSKSFSLASFSLPFFIDLGNSPPTPSRTIAWHLISAPSVHVFLHLPSLLSSPPSLSFCLARKSSFPPWVQQTPVWVSVEKWPAPSETPPRKIPPPSPPRTESCLSR